MQHRTRRKQIVFEDVFATCSSLTRASLCTVILLTKPCISDSYTKGTHFTLIHSLDMKSVGKRSLDSETSFKLRSQG